MNATIEIGTKHALETSPTGAHSVCKHCGAESEVVLSGGIAVRRYRRPGADWVAEVLCSYVPQVSTDGQPTKLIHDHVGARTVFMDRGMLGVPEDEIIDGASLNATVIMVDLSVAFSPVLPYPGERMPSGIYIGSEHNFNLPVDVQELVGGGYGLLPTDKGGQPTLYTPLSPLGPNIIARMRCRYLLQKGAWFKDLGRLDREGQRIIAAAFDIHWRPQAGTALGNAMGVTSRDMLERAPARLPAPPSLDLPPAAVLDGPHGKTCKWWTVNDPSVLDIAKLANGFKLCAEHWERVRVAQGGSFRAFGEHFQYVEGQRYR